MIKYLGKLSLCTPAHNIFLYVTVLYFESLQVPFVGNRINLCYPCNFTMLRDRLPWICLYLKNAHVSCHVPVCNAAFNA